MSKVTCLLLALVALAVLAGCVFAWYNSNETLRPEIRIAAGRKTGLYHTFAEEHAKRLQTRMGRPVRVIETNGSEANIALLREGGGNELALIQTAFLTPDGVAGVAPLFPEPQHFIVRKGKCIRSPANLVGNRVSLGRRTRRHRRPR